MSMYRYCLVVILILIVGQQAFAQQSEATQRLLERNSMFEPEIIQVAKNVYTSIGYQLRSQPKADVPRINGESYGYRY